MLIAASRASSSLATGPAVAPARLAVVLLAALLGLAPGCKPKPSEETPTPAGPVVRVAPEEGKDAVPASLRATDLAPVLRVAGPADRLPAGLIIELAQAIASESQVGGPALLGTELTLEPTLDGALTLLSPTTLRFTPAEPFQPDTDYLAVLVAVATPHATLSSPAADPAWRLTFRSPGFRPLRADWRAVDRASGVASVDVVFSGPVDPARARDALRFSLAGSRLAPRVESTEDPSVLRAHLQAPLSADALLRVEVAAGVPLAGRDGVVAPAAAFDLRVPAAPTIEIVAVRREEGPSGFFVDVICNDAAAPDGWNGFWDDSSDTWYDLSTRCMPDEATAASFIRLSPSAGAVRVSPTRSGFRVLADFARGASTISFAAGLTTRDGGVLPGVREQSFSIPARAPQVQFVGAGRYLPASSFTRLPIRHLNLSEVALAVRLVPERNVVHWLTGDDERADGTTSDLVATATLPVHGPADGFGTSTVDLSAHLPTRAPGVYEISVVGGVASDTTRLLVTDLQLVAKRSAAPPDAPYGPSIDVWAVDTHTLKPLAAVAVDVRRRSGTILSTCTTNGQGYCRLAVRPDPVDPEPPYVVLARRGEDLTYLRFEDLETPLSEAAVDGAPYLAPEAYRVAPYTDRGVYRPGETAHFAAVVRGVDRRAPPPGMPVQLVVEDPRGRVVERAALTTDPVGLLTHDVAFGDWAPTGRYALRLIAGDAELALHALYVEEFVPERMEVTVKASVVEARFGEPVGASIQARYLFGGSAAGSDAELTCELEPTDFTPKENGQYAYGPWRAEDESPRAISLGSASGELGPDGSADLTCPPLPGASPDGPARLVARAAVFEAGSGRSTQNTAFAMVHPERYYLGLLTGTEKAEQGQAIQVNGVVVDWQGKLVDSVREVRLVASRLEDEYGWWYDDDEGSGSYRRALRRVEEGRTTVAVQGGRFTWTVTPEVSGAGFVVAAEAGAARTGLHLPGAGTSYWWSDPDQSVDVTPKPLRPGTLDLQGPERLAVGKDGAVTFVAPYGGRALLSVETHEVTHWEWRDVVPGPVSYTVRVAEFTPNVYVSALLFKDPHSDGAAFLPDRSFGVLSVRLDGERYTQPLTLKAPVEVRPNSDLVIEVEAPGADDEAVVTVAVVDEGILQLTKFETPDPLAALLAKRALGVRSFETVGWSILLPPEGASSTSGGDEASGDLGRAQPVEPVALWSGVVPITRGKATITLPIPSYRGKLRVMAVAVGRERVGRAEASVFVREPLVVQATLPRFVVQGDLVSVPVFVTNTTDAKKAVVVKLSAEDLDASLPGDPFTVASPAEQRLTLAAGASGTAVFDLRALRLVGAARVTVVASSGDLSSKTQAVVPFQPDGPRRRVLHRVELSAGVNDLGPYLTNWLPTTERSTIRVTSNPYGDVFDHLSFLVRYPYGCIEQTTSGTRPLLFVDRLLEQVDPELVADSGVADRVNSGIRRVLSMQTAVGGFAYWPGDDTPTAWGSAYATHMLLDAREQGYDVPERSLDDVLRWMEQQVDLGDGGHGKDGLPYMHYVLARSGRGRKAQAGSLLARLDGVGLDGARQEQVYLLKAALWQAGDRRHEAALRSPDVTAVAPERHNSWSYYSDRRRRGFVLSLFGELFGADAAGEPLASLVAAALQGESRGYTTQELVWGVTGLGRRIKAGASDFSPPVLSVGGKELAPKALADAAGSKTAGSKAGAGSSAPPTAERSWEVARLSERGAVTMTVAKKGPGALYALVASEGVPTDGVWERGGRGLSVRRTVTDLAGDAIDATAVPLGQLVVVRLDLTNTSGERMANVALVDRLPAGFEIENANLGRGVAMDLVDSERRWVSDHHNVRDDRIEVFGALEKGASVAVAYAARATSAGDFVVPPVEAEAMYEPAFWAREVGDRVVIVAPWEALTEGGR